MDWLRLQDYPTSEIIIEEVLERGANYHRLSGRKVDGP
jgi:hypothetical protein